MPFFVPNTLDRGRYVDPTKCRRLHTKIHGKIPFNEYVPLLLVGIVSSNNTRLTILLLLSSTAAYLERLRGAGSCSRNLVESFTTMLLLLITQSTKST
jgi:hypothetical protein